ncbi:MAG: AAA family ATPase [Hespellia sp.]|nr:AAA family ATPase [Hespellia sp.]
MKTKFPEYLSLMRKLRGYTQSQMAERLEISRSTYTNYESGYRSPDFEALEKISEILECSLDDLFGRTIQRTESMLRESNSAYQVKRQPDKKKKLAIGAQDFRWLREANSYFVDKTMLISEFLESNYQVTLITRPRRFGKTMNMSMVAEFLDCTKESADIFEGTHISKGYQMTEMNQHPVLFLSFLNVKGNTATAMIHQLVHVLREAYEKYAHERKSEKVSDYLRKNAEQIERRFNQEKLSGEEWHIIVPAISILCQVLQEYYGEKVYLLLDEYDTPFISANVGGYYDEVRGILSGMYSSSLKGNAALEKALVTGIQRVAKENIFSGLNNLVVCTVNEPEYAEYFGFTETETEELLRYYGLELSDEVKDMYDGYLFGSVELYNPWSITSYAARKKLNYYWVNTSENSMIQDALENSSRTFVNDYEHLIEQGTVEVQLDLESSYYEQADDASLWGLLVNAGMITILEEIEDDFCIVKVPNDEVRKEFQKLTAHYLKVQEGHIAKMLRHLKSERIQEFLEEYRLILLELPSYYDLKNENSYHMMMLGMCAFLYKDYEVKSNRESGNGRSDILLCSKKTQYPNFILEFKYAKDDTDNLDSLAQTALNQIKEKQYEAGLDGKVYAIGLAHSGKKVEMKSEIF